MNLNQGPSNVKTIGRLMANSRLGHFWPEGLTCLNWLDEQPWQSVLYIAFGSHTVLDKKNSLMSWNLGLSILGNIFYGSFDWISPKLPISSLLGLTKE